MDGEVHRRRRRLPHWTMEGAIYFITFRVIQGEFTGEERAIVLAHVRSGHNKYYCLYAVVVMPDHVHLLISPNQGVDLSRIMKGIKGVSARLINEHRGNSGPVWQEEGLDRIMRDQNEFDTKLNYMLTNPVKKNLVTDGWDYDGWYCEGGL